MYSERAPTSCQRAIASAYSSVRLNQSSSIPSTSSGRPRRNTSTTGEGESHVRGNSDARRVMRRCRSSSSARATRRIVPSSTTSMTHASPSIGSRQVTDRVENGLALQRSRQPRARVREKPIGVLDPLSVRDVAEHHRVNALSRREIQPGDRRFSRKLVAVLPSTGNGTAMPHAPRGLAALAECSDLRVVRSAESLGKQDRYRLADRLVRRVAEDLLRAAVEVDDAMRVVDGDDGIGGNRQDSGELCFRRAELFVTPPPVRAQLGHER